MVSGQWSVVKPTDYIDPVRETKSFLTRWVVKLLPNFKLQVDEGPSATTAEPSPNQHVLVCLSHGVYTDSALLPLLLPPLPPFFHCRFTHLACSTM